MPIARIQIEEFLALSGTSMATGTRTEKMPVLDVRSPTEYEHAHIPGALSFPLFTNEERKTIGTAYKQESREKAIKIGLASFGQNLLPMIEQAEKILPPKSDVIVHCWRGGMRSAAVAWLLDLYGYKVYQLAGGYKAWRKWALLQFEKQYPVSIIGGYTGSNKTGLLQELKKQGEYIIDLEALAGHMGSAFGNLDRTAQPTQEQFENLFALELYRFSQQNLCKTIWMENESQRIGQVNVPHTFYQYFSAQPCYFLDVPFEERLKHIVQGYGKASKENLINAIVRITKKLGGPEAKTAINCLMDDDISGCFSILLKYYDRLYRKNGEKRKQDQRAMTRIMCENTDARANLDHLFKSEALFKHA